VVALAVLGALVLLALPIWGHPDASDLPLAAQVVVVQRGDTLSSIVRQVDPSSGARQLRVALQSELDGGPLVPGARLVIPRQ